METKPTTTTYKAFGRPCKQDYEARRDFIQRQIDSGMSIQRLAKEVGLSYSGMRLVLAKMGISTTTQKIRSMGLSALLDSMQK